MSGIAFSLCSKVLSALAMVFYFASASMCQENYGTWRHSSSIPVNTAGSGHDIRTDLIHFPYLVRLSAANFAFGQARADGRDIRFSKINGAHLSYQIDAWDSAGGSAAIWVRLDTLRGNDSVQAIKIYWGNNASSDSSSGRAVFAAADGFAAVWHFSPSDTFGDATANAIGLTNSNSTRAALSIIGTGRTLNGTANTNLSAADNAVLNMANGLTLSAWVKSADATADQKVAGKNVLESGYMLAVNSSAVDAECWDNAKNGHRPHGGTIRSNRWTHIAVTWATGGQMTAYVDGVAVDSISAGALALGTTTNKFYIGCPGWDQANLLFKGDVDEVEVASVARSADWIRLCCRNQAILPVAAPKISYPRKNIFIPINTFTDSIVPVISGIVDNLTITPYLPKNLLFDAENGVITGSAADLTWEQPYYITASNLKGSTTDTIYITIDKPTGAPAGRKETDASFKLIGVLSHCQQPRIFFRMPVQDEFTDFIMTMYDLKGIPITSSRVMTCQPGSGIQSVPIGGQGDNKAFAGGIYLIELKAKGSRTGRTAIQRVRSMFFH
jgi:hypothetical protein